MANHHFLSYSRATREFEEFAAHLCDELLVGVPSYRVWLDTREIRPGQEWDSRIPEAIATCDSLLFVMTRDSVADESVCRKEWTRALRCKKPIIPLRLHSDAELPFRIDSLQYIDFTDDFDLGLARLRLHLKWLPSPQGVLHSMNDLLAIARYDLSRAADSNHQARIQADIALLEKQIADQEKIVKDLQGTARRVVENIERGLERERQPSTRLDSRSRFINQPLTAAPSYFQDRSLETQLIGDFLKDDALRLMMVVGRGGTGKTAMVNRLLKCLERGVLPDDGGALDVDGIVYLSTIGVRKINLLHVYTDLLKLAPEQVASELEALYKNPQASTKTKVQSLLAAIPGGRIIVLLDNFEDLIDPVTLNIRDNELDEGLRALLDAPNHAVKVIITTRVVPRELALVQPGRQRSPLYLDEGLPSPFAENILRALDAEGKVGLKSAPADLLAEARERTRGYPRALEALYMILSVDRDRSLREILNDTAEGLPDNVVRALVGEAFSLLDPAAQQVVQALAIYGRPVTPTACDYLLQPYLPGVDSAPVLKRLVSWLFVRKEAGRYSLHPEDRAYALSRVPKGTKEERGNGAGSPFTQIALQRQGADYFRQRRIEVERWKTIEDLEPQLAEFELRYAGEDYETAGLLVLQIGSKLYSWGHYRLLVELHERLRDRLEDKLLNSRLLTALSLPYWKLGYLRKAIAVLEQTLPITRELHDRANEGATVNNLGLIYDEMGQTARALANYREAIGLASSVGSRTEAYLNNLGRTYADRGQCARGIRFSCQAVYVAAENLDTDVEAIALNNIGYMFMDSGDLDRAIRLFQTSIQKADATNCVPVRHHGRYRLALAYLFKGDLTAARVAAEAALAYDVPENKHHLEAALGLILLDQGDRAAARQRFAEALAQADLMQEFSPENYGAVEVKGLVFSGLALCDANAQVNSAIAAYQAARDISHERGVWARVVRLFETLAKVDTAGLLAPVRAAVFTSAIATDPDYFRSPEFVDYVPADIEEELITPPVSPHEEWVNVYFGHPSEPEKRTQDFHRILREESLIDEMEFRDFVSQHKPQLGNLLIHHAGLLEIVSRDGRGRRMFFASQETVEKLLAL